MELEEKRKRMKWLLFLVIGMLIYYFMKYGFSFMNMAYQQKVLLWFIIGTALAVLYSEIKFKKNPQS